MLDSGRVFFKLSAKKDMKEKLIFWTPRILTILLILFMMLLSLDVFSMTGDIWEKLGGLLIHNIPAFILMIILIISWKYEIFGGIAFLLIGLFYIITILFQGFELYAISWMAQISLPAFIISILFFIGWFRKRKSSIKPSQR